MSYESTGGVRSGPTWATWIGAFAVILGVYLAANHGIEAMKLYTVVTSTSSEAPARALRCPPDELAEEGISEEDCKQMAAMVEAQLRSRPNWFRTFQLTVESIGIGLSLLTIFTGISLIDWHPWAPVAAIATFGALAGLNVVDFIVVLNMGPLLRELYLWNLVLWILLPLGLTAGTIAGRREVPP